MTSTEILSNLLAAVATLELACRQKGDYYHMHAVIPMICEECQKHVNAFCEVDAVLDGEVEHLAMLTNRMVAALERAANAHGKTILKKNQ